MASSTDPTQVELARPTGDFGDYIDNFKKIMWAYEPIINVARMVLYKLTFNYLVRVWCPETKGCYTMAIIISPNT